jgi:hypothetical protein
MQLSIKTSPELTRPLLEKCAVFAEKAPSNLVCDLAWQCLKSMDMPHYPFHPFERVQRYYWLSGREAELLVRKEQKQDELMERLTLQNRQKRTAEAAVRLKAFKALLKKQPLPKHLHLKISQGMSDLPQRIKAKAEWLSITPNALVMACVRDGLEAMDDLAKAIVPPPIVVQFWSASHAKLRRKPANVTDAMIMKNLDETLRQRGGPILDTIVRLALSEQWNATLREILRDADALTNEWMPKD